MAWFTYSFRDKTGDRRTDFIEASSRSEAFEMLRRQGIVPLALQEGQIRRDGHSHVSKWRLICLSLMVFVVVGTGLWLVLSPPEHPSRVQQSQTRTSKPQKAAPVDAPPAHEILKDQSVSKEADRQLSGTDITHSGGKDRYLDQEVLSRDVRTNGTRVVERIRTADGKSHMIVNDITKPVFDNPSDQVLGMALSMPAGQSMPPIPMAANIDKEFRKSLEREIVITDDDSPKVKEMKLAVKQAREDVKALLDKGLTMQEVLREHQKLVNENAETRNGAVLELKRIIAEGDYESAVKYAEEINKAFRQMGIMELSVPARSAAEDEQLKAERRAARKTEHEN